MYISPSLEYRNLSEWLGKLANKTTTPLKFARSLSKFLNKQKHPVRVHVIPNQTLILDPGQFCFGGEYDPNLDERGRKQFIIDFMVTIERKDSWVLAEDEVQEMALELTELLVHEYEHQRQYRQRRYRVRKSPYYGEAEEGWVRREQEYLGHPDEFEAYAMNIAARFYLLRYVVKSKSKYHCTDLKRYLKTFGRQHRITQQLVKKVRENINYYKENDNGKTHRRSCKRPRIRRL